MNNDKETPEELRERLRQEELKKPFSSIHGSNLSDLVGGMGWRYGLEVLWNNHPTTHHTVDRIPIISIELIKLG